MVSRNLPNPRCNETESTHHILGKFISTDSLTHKTAGLLRALIQGAEIPEFRDYGEAPASEPDSPDKLINALTEQMNRFVQEAPTYRWEIALVCRPFIQTSVSLFLTRFNTQIREAEKFASTLGRDGHITLANGEWRTFWK